MAGTCKRMLRTEKLSVHLEPDETAHHMDCAGKGRSLGNAEVGGNFLGLSFQGPIDYNPIKRPMHATFKLFC